MLGDLLGRGGMAEVFSGHVMGDHGFQKPVAIKRLLPELANDKVFVERLIGEAKLLVGLQHGNIVSVLDLARDGEDVFLVMDFVDGPSLRQLLKARGTRGLPLGVASYVVQSAAAGLEFAHARPGGAIVHADISPSNLLLTTSGEVRVADFGIARREGGGHGIVEGKWAYMAPEQARGEPLSPRSDVFALGVVLYELITGAHPFGRQVTADERESQQMRVIPPRVVRPSVPHGLDQICMKALAHDPRDRYARMQHMIDAILDERFANQWREGASDLASAIREVAPQAASGGGAVGPRTMVTDRPVTIVTRSLIEPTPHRRSAQRMSSPRIDGTPAPSVLVPTAATLHGSESAIENESFSASESASASASDSMNEATSMSAAAPVAPPPAMPMFDVSPALRLDGAAMPAFRLPDTRMPANDLASVHGGTAHSVHHAAAPVGEAARSNKWPILVMSTAAVLGVVAAVALQMRPTEVGATPAKEATVVAQQETTPAKPDQAPVVEPPAPPVTVAVVNIPTPPAPQPTVPTVSETAPAQPASDEAVQPAQPTEATPSPAPKAAARKSTAATTAPKKGTGILRIAAAPWAWVQIDGGPRFDGNGRKFNLAPGRHTVRLWNDVGDQKVTKVTIEPNKLRNIRVNFEDDTLEID